MIKTQQSRNNLRFSDTSCWVSSNSILLWHCLPGVSARCHTLRAQSYKIHSHYRCQIVCSCLLYFWLTSCKPGDLLTRSSGSMIHWKDSRPQENTLLTFTGGLQVNGSDTAKWKRCTERTRLGLGWGGEHGASSSSPAPPCVNQTGSSLNPVLQGFYEGFIM